MKPINQSRSYFSYFYHTLQFLLLAIGLLGCGRSTPPPVPTISPTDTPVIEIIETPEILPVLPTPPDAPLEQYPLSNDFSDYQTISGSAEIVEPPTLTTPQEAALAVVRIRGCDAYGNCVDNNQGSGAIIHPKGIILTAWHVTVLDPRNQALPNFYDHFLIEITDDVSSPPQPRYYARWIAYNIQDDLALLRIVGEFEQPQENWEQTVVDLPWLPISNDARPVQPELWVMGYPSKIRTVAYPSYRYSGLEGSQIRISEAIPKGFSGGPTLVQKEDGYEIIGVVSNRVQDIAFIHNIQQLDNLIWLPKEQMWAENAQIVNTEFESEIQSQLEVTIHTLGYRATKFDIQSALLLVSDGQEEEAQQRLLAANFVTIQQLSIPLDQNNALFNEPLFISIFRLDEGEVWRVDDWIMSQPAEAQGIAVDTAAIATPSPIAVESLEDTAFIPTSIPTSTLDIGATYVNPVDGATYVYVPASEFIMGTEDGASDESPQHKVYLDEYWIMKTEVTNAQYSKFMEAGGYTTEAYWSPEGWSWRTKKNLTQPRCWDNSNFNGLQQPVVCISWYAAEAYANWLSEETGLDFGLPTEAQWEKAARGSDGRIYPWGNQWDNSKANSLGNDDGYQYTAPVGSYLKGASPYGVLNMAGNVWEWTADWYETDSYKTSLDHNPLGSESGDTRVLRGGSLKDNPGSVRAGNRNWARPNYWFDSVGVRLVYHETEREN